MVEAIAKWDCSGNGEDFLAFKQGDVIKITALDVKIGSSKWFRAYLNGKHGFVPDYMIELPSVKWFWGGEISKEEAETLLLSKPSRKLLIRETPPDSLQFFLSFKRSTDNGVFHFRILCTPEINFYFFKDFNGPKFFSSLNQLANYVKRNSWYSAPWWVPYEEDEERRRRQLEKHRKWSPNH